MITTVRSPSPTLRFGFGKSKTEKREPVHVVIAGAGVAGTTVAAGLNKEKAKYYDRFLQKTRIKKSPAFDITLIEPNDFISYPPQLPLYFLNLVREKLSFRRYQSKDASLTDKLLNMAFHTKAEETALNPAIISMEEFKKHNPYVKVIKNAVIGIDREKRTLRINSPVNPEIPYDKLVLATGGEDKTFGIKGLLENTLSFSNPGDIEKLADKLIQYAQAGGQKNIYILGSGPTGLEAAGVISQALEIANVDKPKVYVVECMDAIMPPPGIDAQRVRRYLEQQRNVTFLTGHLIQEVKPDGSIRVTVSQPDGTKTQDELKDGAIIVRALGTKGKKAISDLLPGNKTPDDRVILHPDLSTDDTNIYGAGDGFAIALNPDEPNPKVRKYYPPTGQNAIQQALTEIWNILADINQKTGKKMFEYKDRGTDILLDEDAAIVKMNYPFAGLFRRMIGSESKLRTLIHALKKHAMLTGSDTTENLDILLKKQD